MMTTKKILASLIVIAIASGSLSGKLPVEHRTRLNDGWTFLKSDLGSIWETVRPVRPGQPENYPLWQNVTLPHCFNATDCVDPDVNYYQGPGWYKTLLDVDNPYPDGRTVLEFEGAGQKTDVYVYMTKVGSHVGGYDSWNLDITDAVDDFLGSDDAERFGGKVPLSIRCDNSRDAEMIPSDISDFNIYGGIYRYLNLVYLPSVAIDEIHVTTELANDHVSGSVVVECSFYNMADVRSADVEVTIKSPDGDLVDHSILSDIVPLGKRVVARITVSNPILWDVDSPNLYTCEVSVGNDKEEIFRSVEKFGFREFEFVDYGPFMLNGRRLLLHGTHRHEDHAGVAAAMTDSMMAREMELMKEMGVNFIRLGHYQQSEIILDLCDSLGILVWEEIPWCRGGLGGEKYQNQARRMLSNMINQHYNHPSVIIWGLGNENDWPNDFPEFEQGEIRRFMNELNTIAHSLDGGRKTAIRRCDFCKDIVDVYSPSLWAGWYSGDYHQYRELSMKWQDIIKHFLHVEWGGDSHPGRYSEDASPSKDDWSESYIVKLMDWHLKEQEEMPWLTGSAFWPFKDFATPVRPENPVPYVNQKGVVERDLRKKESYYVFQSYWTDEPMVHIFGRDRAERWGGSNDEKEILVYSNCLEVELFVNGESQGVKRRDPADYPAAGLHWTACLIPGENIVEARAIGAGTEVSDSTRWEYVTDSWGEPSAICTTVEEAGADVVRVNVSLVDSRGNVCLDSRKVVRFEIAGDGSLIKNQGTARAASKLELSNGRASILAERKGGRSVVAVSSEGLPTAFVEI